MMTPLSLEAWPQTANYHENPHNHSRAPRPELSPPSTGLKGMAQGGAALKRFPGRTALRTCLGGSGTRNDPEASSPVGAHSAPGVAGVGTEEARYTRNEPNWEKTNRRGFFFFFRPTARLPSVSPFPAPECPCSENLSLYLTTPISELDESF